MSGVALPRVYFFTRIKERVKGALKLPDWWQVADYTIGMTSAYVLWAYFIREAPEGEAGQAWRGFWGTFFFTIYVGIVFFFLFLRKRGQRTPCRRMMDMWCVHKAQDGMAAVTVRYICGFVSMVVIIRLLPTLMVISIQYLTAPFPLWEIISLLEHRRIANGGPDQ